MSNGETIVEANGVNLCVETFGDSGDPAILLIHGASASMLWWEAELCQRIADAGRYVIRFDNRDTGRSVSYPPGRPGYTLRDMADDALGVLDALNVTRAHVVGRSMAGAIAVLVAAQHPDRVGSLTLVNTTTNAPNLPPPSQEFIGYTSSGAPDPSDRAAVVEFIVGLMRVYSGPSPYFDEGHVRDLAEQDMDRTQNVASCLINHFVIDTSGSVDFGAIRVPTVVVQGEDDRIYSMEHGQALRQAIPGAELLVLEKAGHEVPEPVWEPFVQALVRQSAG